MGQYENDGKPKGTSKLSAKAVESINRQVRSLYAETGDTEPPDDWREMPEERFWYHYCRCAFSSRRNFDRVDESTNLIEKHLQGIHQKIEDDREGYENVLLDFISSKDISRLFRTALAMKDRGLSFKRILEGYALESGTEQPDASARQARLYLTYDYAIVGLGTKNASMFLRKVGYYPHFALLDVHVNDYLEAAGVVCPGTYDVSGLYDYYDARHVKWEGYETVEAKFQGVARELGCPVKFADETIWRLVREEKKKQKYGEAMSFDEILRKGSSKARGALTLD